MASPWERFLGRPAATTMVEETSVGIGGALRRCVLTASSSPWMEVIGILLGLGTGWYLRRRGLRAEREQQQQRRQLRQAASLAHPQGMLTDGAPRTSTAVAAIVPVGGSLIVAGDGRRRRKRGAGRGAPADGEAAGEGRSSLSERLARGVPVLGATLLWQLLMKIDGPPSLLDPLAAVLSWFFLELIMVSVPRVVWKKWDMGNPEEAGRRGVAAGPGAHVPHLMLGTVREAEEGTLGEEGKDEAVPLSRENRDTGAAMLPPSSPPILPFDGHLGRGRGGGGGGGANGSARAAPAAAVHGFEEVAPVTPYAAAMSEPGPRTFVRRRRTAHGTAAARQTAAAAMTGGGVGGTEAAAAAMAATMAAGGGERGAGQEWRQQHHQQLQEPAGQDGAYTHAGSGALTAAEAAPTATAPCTPDEMQAGRGSEGVSTDKNGSSTATAAGLNREKHTRAPDQGSSPVAAAAAASAVAAPARVSPARDGGAARMLKLRPRAFMGDGAAAAGPTTPSKLASGRACLSRAIGSPGAYATPPPPPPPSPSSSIAPRRTGGTTRGAIAKNEPRARPRRRQQQQQQQQQHGQAGLKLVDMNTTRVLTPDAAAVGACVGENGVGRGIGKGAASASDGCHGGGVAGTGGGGCRTPASGGGAGSPVKTRSSKRRHPGVCYSPRGPSEDEFPAAKRAMLMGVKRGPSWDGWSSGSGGGGSFGGSGGGSFGGFGVVDEQQLQRQESEQRIGRQPQQEYQQEMQRQQQQQQQQQRIEDQLRPGDEKEELQQHQHQTEEQLQQHDGRKKSQQPRPEQRIGRQSQQEYTQEMQRQQQQQQQQIECHVRPGEGKEDLHQPQPQPQPQHQTEESVERQPRPANKQKELQLPQQQGPHQEGSPNGQASGGAGDVTTDAVADTGAACATETGECSIAAETPATRTTTTKTAKAEAATSSAIRDGLASSAKDLSIPSTSSFSSFTVATKATFSSSSSSASSSSSSSSSPSSTASSSARETPPAAPIPALAPSAPATAPGGPRRGSEGNESGREGGMQGKAEVGPGSVPATDAKPGPAARTSATESPAAAAAASAAAAAAAAAAIVEAGAAAVPASSETPEGSEAPAALGWRERGTLLSLDASLTSGGGVGRGDGDGRDGPEESGTPVPPELRPPGREVDVLWEWRLEQLRVDDEVGMFSRGSFGKVVAVRTEMDQQMAVKIVAKSAMSPERYIERELDLLEACSVHPNVVGLHGVIRTSERVYVLMPLADTDLAAMVKSTVLDEKQAAFCVRQVVSAVEFLHKRGIVHRDVKPANILVLSNKVLLADFGLAKQLPRVNGRTGLLVGACGTKPYLAPELVRDVPYDAAVDLWALGVVTYELLHGYTPFSPKLVTPRSWDGVVREDYAPRINSDRHDGGGGGGTNSLSSNIRAYPGDSNVEGFCLSVDNRSSTLSVSESSGSIVTNNRMFERSAPPAAGGGSADGAAAGRRGLDRAWLVGQAHQALLFGKGAENDEYREERRTSGGGVSGGGDGGGGQGGGGVRRRRGHREADQLKLLDAIVRGDYEVEESRVGVVCAGFISQLLQTCPGRRMSAAVAAEHPFLGPVSKVAPRRRAARAEAAAVQTERAANAAERCKARILQQQQQQQQQGLGRSSAVAASATAEAAAALTNIATLAGAMSAEARSLLADAKRWDKAAAEAEAAAAAASAADGDCCSGGVDGGPGLAAKEAGAAAEEAAEKAESAVRRAELLARESRAGCAAAEAVARSRELAEEQERAAGLPAARKECASNGAAVVERSKGGSGDLVPSGGGGGGVGSGVGSVGDGGGVEGGLSTGNGSVSTVAGEQRQ